VLASTPKTRKAYNISAFAHEGQRRKGDGRLPYFVHPLGVALITSQMTSDEDMICAAFLHDIEEEVPPEIYSRGDMLLDFGDDVVHIVDILTKNPTIKGWRQTKDSQIATLQDTDCEGALVVGLADKSDNAQATIDSYALHGEETWDRFGGGRDGQLWWFQTLHDEVFTPTRMPEYAMGQVRAFGELVMELEQLGGQPIGQRKAS
jgi:(p)ppGpp synthase/HD superfamily hydrolase